MTDQFFRQRTKLFFKASFMSLGAVSILIAMIIGCGDNQDAPVSINNDVLQATPHETQAAEAGTENSDKNMPVMAYVNGKPIYMYQLNKLMMEIHGYDLSEELIGTELVRQELLKRGLSITEQDIKKEHLLTLKNNFQDVDDEAQLERLLEQLLAQKKVSRRRWEIAMRRNAMLRKLITKDVVVTDQDINRTFGAKYGRKVEVRHILCESAESAQDVIRKIRGGADFVELVRKYSKHSTASSGGMLPPIGPDTVMLTPNVKLPQSIKQAALAMNKIGQISDPVLVGEVFHVLKLENIIEPKDVQLEDVKADLAEEIRNRRIMLAYNQIITALHNKAKIEYIEPTLRTQQSLLER